MSDEPKRSGWIDLAGLALFPLYLSLVRPAYWVANHSPVQVPSVEFLNRIFSPLWHLWSRSDSAKKLINWHVRAFENTGLD
jgi:hypothetical protein